VLGGRNGGGLDWCSVGCWVGGMGGGGGAAALVSGGRNEVDRKL
jgi:hypothetical protein